MATNSGINLHYFKDIPRLQDTKMGMLILSSIKWYAAFLKVPERVDILLVSFYSRATWLLDLLYSTVDL